MKSTLVPRPRDVENPAFPPVNHDRVARVAVLVFNVPVSDTITATITDGASIFSVTDLSSYDLTLTEADPSDLPPGHPPVLYWDETLAVRTDGSTNLPVSESQRVHVTVSLLVREHTRLPGALTATLGIQGTTISRALALTGMYLAVDERTAIGQRWRDMGGEAFFGTVYSNEHFDATGPGVAQEFANGVLYEISGAGVRYFTNDAFTEWRGGTPLGDKVSDDIGNPLEDTITRPDGIQVQRFQFGAIVVRPDRNGIAILNKIYGDYSALPGDMANPALEPYPGLPLSNEQANVGGRFQLFDAADYFWSPVTGAHAVAGFIRQHWYDLGGGPSFLGLPVTDENVTGDGHGRFNWFQGGVIYWSPSTGAHEVHGEILKHWEDTGAESGRYGYPIGDEEPWTNPDNGVAGRMSRFERGIIGWTPSDGIKDLETVRTVSDSIITPAGTALGGSVTMTLRYDGTYSVDFFVHSSSVLEGFDFQVRAVYVASNGLALVAQHSGHVGGVSTDTHSEQGSNEAIRAFWPEVLAGRLWVTKQYDTTGIVGFVEDLLQDVVDVVAGVAGAALGVIIGLTAEVGQLFGTLGLGVTFGIIAGVVVFASGGALLLAVAAGAVVGAVTEALVKQRGLTDEEFNLLAPVFLGGMPARDKIVLTNLAGLGGNAFTMPGVDGRIFVNLGAHLGNALDPLGSAYSARGQVLVHEMTHAWQIDHASFLPTLTCEAVIVQGQNQLGASVYEYGPPGPPWRKFNLEQQGAIVDQWFAGTPTAVVPIRNAMDPNDPYFAYIDGNIRAGQT